MEWLKARASVSSSIRAYFLYIINTYPPTTGIHVKVDERMDWMDPWPIESSPGRPSVVKIANHF